MRTVHVVGLDVSLTNTGVAVLGCTPQSRWTIHTYTVRTAPKANGGGAPEPLLLERMTHIVHTVMTAAEHADVIGIERPAFAAKGNATATLAGLWWLVYRRLSRLDIPIVIVSASSAKKYATSSGTAAKRDVSRAATRMFPEIDTRSGDEDDALVIAALAADLADLPVPYDRTAYRRTALANVARPDNLEPLA